MATPSSGNASNPVKTALIVAAGSAALIIGLALIAHYAVGAYGGRSLEGDPAMSDAAVAKRLQPVGEFVVADANAPKTLKSGEQVYGAVCAACHAAGVLNSPKFGDKAAWAPHIAAGYEQLVDNAIKGIRSMPPRGGNPELADVEVARAVAYMADAAGANFKPPEAPAASTAAAPVAETARPTAAAAPVIPLTVAAAPAPPANAGATPPAAATSDPAKGKSVYETTCVVCHGAGVAGAPRFGDKAAWAPRIAEGAETLHSHALNGFQGKSGVMPPKGGNVSLADADVSAAVDYMVAQSK